MREVVLDTETTGLNPRGGDRLVEIGCVEIDNLIPTSNKFHCYLNPERKVSEKALMVHGYSDEFLADKKKFAEVVDEFLLFIKDKKLVIHNADFDLGHLNNELGKLGKAKIEKKDVIDTLEIARNKFPGSQISLDALCKRFRIDNSRRKKHTALVDCDLLTKVYINLLDQKEPKLNFLTNNQPTNEKEVIKDINYFKKIVLPSNEEIKLHKEYLRDKLKKNFFN